MTNIKQAIEHDVENGFSFNKKWERELNSCGFHICTAEELTCKGKVIPSEKSFLYNDVFMPKREVDKDEMILLKNPRAVT